MLSDFPAGLPPVGLLKQSQRPKSFLHSPSLAVIVLILPLTKGAGELVFLKS